MLRLLLVCAINIGISGGSDDPVCLRPRQNICSMPGLPQPRYYFNAATQQCEPFNFFDGCDGNGNNFFILEACECECKSICSVNQSTTHANVITTTDAALHVTAIEHVNPVTLHTDSTAETATMQESTMQESTSQGSTEGTIQGPIEGTVQGSTMQESTEGTILGPIEGTVQGSIMQESTVQGSTEGTTQGPIEGTVQGSIMQESTVQGSTDEIVQQSTPQDFTDYTAETGLNKYDYIIIAIGLVVMVLVGMFIVVAIAIVWRLIRLRLYRTKIMHKEEPVVLSYFTASTSSQQSKNIIDGTATTQSELPSTAIP